MTRSATGRVRRAPNQAAPTTVRRLGARHGDAASTLAASPGLSRRGDLGAAPRDAADAAAEAGTLHALVAAVDSDYPAQLAESDSASPTVAVRGVPNCRTSRPSPWLHAPRRRQRVRRGDRTDAGSGPGRCARGVGGLARGTDAAARQRARQRHRRGGGRGAWMRSTRRTEYRDLHERVVRDGVVVLEMPPARGRQPATSRDATASLSG